MIKPAEYFSMNRIMIIVWEKEITKEKDVLDWKNMGTYALLE